IYRSNTSNFGYQQVYFGSYIPSWNDTGLVNYNTYYYRFVAHGTSFSSGYSREYEVIPKLNTMSADACVIINGGNKTTPTNKVTLNIYQTKNDNTNNSIKTAFPVTHMRISNDPSLIESLSWIPFNNETIWYLTAGAGVKFVFVQLRDNQPVPEVSPIFSAGIYYNASTFEIGIEHEITLFLIIVNIVTIALIFYKKKNKPIKIFQY
ncbi:MAG: hypothetical protein ACTSPY_18460, partial [Candidatus Helarchaeota archaeon]